ncbi:MAG: hypothetical protein WD027_00320 [Gaiellales bacterium]
MDAILPSLLKTPYEEPEILDFGSIADHTFLRCGGTGVNGGGHTPPKDFPYPPAYHLDKFGECSALALAVSP